MIRSLIRNISLAVFTAIIIISGSCKSAQQSFDSKDLSYLYNPTKNPINPRYNVINKSENSSEFSIKFFSSDLFFSEANPRGVPMSMILVTVKLFNVTVGTTLSDTSVLDLNIVQETGRTEYVYNMELRVEPGNKYMAEVKILDKLRLTVVQSFIPFNTLSEFNRYNFVPRGHFEKNLLFNPVLKENEYVNIVYTRGQIF